MTTLLSVNHLSVAFTQDNQQSLVVDDVSFALEQGKTLALVGESGSGKSVTAHSILKLLPYPQASHPSGTITYQDTDLLQAKENELRGIRGNHIAMIFQEPMTALNPLHTVEKQIGEVLAVHKGLRPMQARQRILELLHEVHISDPERRLNAYPHELSGGQRQRIMIAMALANEPEILIADEPTTALDVTVQREIMQLLGTLQQRYNMAILLITHDLGVVRRYSHSVAVMKEGRIIEQGDTETLFQHPQTAYTRLLIDSNPHGSPIALSNEQYPTLLSARQLTVKHPLEKPLFRKARHFFTALDSVNIDIEPGSTLGVVGESGSGKSTLALALLRLISSNGDIHFSGQALHSLKQAQLRPLRSQLQVVFQDPFASLSPRMTVAEIITEGLQQHTALSEREREDKLIQTLHDVGLDPSTRHRYPHEFSGGQRQRIAIARAIILEPRLIFLDEPTSALDRAVQVQVLNLLRDLQEKYQLTYVFISHDIKVIKAISHYVAVMRNGSIIEYGEAKKVLNHPENTYTQLLLEATL